MQNSQAIFKSLFEISKIAAKAKSLDDLYQPLFNHVLDIFKFDAGSLMLLEGDFLVRKAAVGIDQEVLKEPPIAKARGGFSWQAVQSKKCVFVYDLPKDKIASKIIANSNFKSLVAVPLVSRGVVIGTMSIFTKKAKRVTEDELDLFTTVAQEMATAIVSIQASDLLEENRRKVKELEDINQIARSVSNLFNFDETLYSITGLIVRNVGGEQGVISLFDHRDKLIHSMKPAYGLTNKQVDDLRQRNDEGITGQAFCKGVPVIAHQIDRETKIVLERAGIFGVKSLLVAPLKVKSQTLGILTILSSKENNFEKSQVPFFSVLASQAAVVVESAVSFRQISTEKNKDEALLSSIGEGVVALNEKGEIMLLNIAGEQLTGYLAQELMGKHFSELLTLYDNKANLADDQHCPLPESIAKGVKKQCEAVYLKKRSGELFAANLSVAPILNEEKQNIGTIIVFRDISEQLKVEEMKQELISIATHELRAPITAQKGYLEMLIAQEAGEVTKEGQEILQEMQIINQRLADLVDDLLNVSRIEQGRVEVKPVEFELNEKIDQVVKQFEAQAEQKSLKLSFEKTGEIKIKTDPERLEQIIINLISNAIKYTPSGSIDIVTVDKGQKAVIAIKDTGVGLSEKEKQRLFEKFYRAKNAKTRQEIGTGLGLWITKQLVEMLKGEIKVESAEGAGSTFAVSLPIQI